MANRFTTFSQTLTALLFTEVESLLVFIPETGAR